MRRLLRLSQLIDRANVAIGRAVSWLTLAMVAVGAYNAVVRYVGRWTGTSLSSNFYIELQWYMFSLVFLMSAAYTLRKNAHVRVDVLYGRVSDRARAWIDLVGTALFLVPFSLLTLWVTWPAVRNSWAVREVSPDPGGLARYPIKTVILLAFVLLIVQGISEAIKRVAFLRGLGPAADDDHEPGAAGHLEGGGA